MIEPRCADCPLNGKKKIYGEGVTVLETTDEIRESANPQILIKQVIVDSPQAEHYPVVMVGMAPAENEEIQSRVLVGVSGQILRSLLVKLGYTKVYLCNSLLCRIPDEWNDKDEKRALAEDCCKERLLSEIRDKTPDLIVAMGAMPTKELIGDYPITKVAGRVFPSSYTRYPIANMLPTIHPAYVWGMPELFLDLVE